MTTLDAPQSSTAPIRPQDDFFYAINGEWIKNYELPADKAGYGSFNKLADDAEEQLRDIVEDPNSTSPLSKIVYNLFMDMERLEKDGNQPVQAYLKRFLNVTSKDKLLETLGELDPVGGPAFFSIDVDADPGNPEMNKMFISQGGLGLPDESYYREDQHAPIREAYVAMLTRLFLLGQVDSDEKAAHDRAENVLAVETGIARHHWDQVTDRDDDKTFNPTTFADLAARMPHFDLAAWVTAWQKGYDQTLSAAELPVSMKDAMSELIVREPDFFNGLDSEWESRSVEDLKNWALAHVLIGSASYLNNDFQQASFDFYGKILNGTTKMRDRWKRAVSLVDTVTGEEIGQEYVKRHFPASSKQRMEKLVQGLIEAYHVSITNSTWLSEETKKKALEKLSKFRPMIGYTKHWRDYTALHLDSSLSLLENMHRADAFGAGIEVSKAGKAVDPEEWFMTPQTVNAYYAPNMNVIVFPAAILQPPFFDPEADDATNFGGIGAVIGHEIGHGFDDQGSKYDGDGRMHNWWTAEDRENFEKLTHALIAQYDQFVPRQLEEKYEAEGKKDQAPHVKGALTIGENIGDLSGVNIALKAYVLGLGLPANNEEELEAGLAQAPVIDGKSAAERFFLNYAEIWRGVRRDEIAEQLLIIDPHSPAEFRVNGIVSNVDAFYSTFHVEPGDGMWIDPDKRVRIW